MQDKEIYHASAVQYNEALAIAAEEQASSVQDPVVKKWCTSIAKQHRFHLKRHRAALAKIQGEARVLTPEEMPAQTHEKSVAEEQAEFAAQQQANEGTDGEDVISEEEHVALEGKV
jgi:hypothetical protein